MSKNNAYLKQIDITEYDFKNREEFLKWREEILKQYEKNKEEYYKEVEIMFQIKKDEN